MKIYLLFDYKYYKESEFDYIIGYTRREVDATAWRHTEPFTRVYKEVKDLTLSLETEQ